MTLLAIWSRILLYSKGPHTRLFEKWKPILFGGQLIAESVPLINSGRAIVRFIGDAQSLDWRVMKQLERAAYRLSTTCGK